MVANKQQCSAHLPRAVHPATAVHAAPPIDVEYAELDALLDLDALPNDPLYSSQWALGKVRAAGAWDTSTGSSAVKVCVIDTGIDYK